MRQLNTEAADWLLRMRAPDFSAEDRLHLDAWLAGDVARANALARAQSMLELAPRAFAVHEATLPAPRIVPMRRRVWLPVSAGLAASLALFMLFDGPMRLRADLRTGTDMAPATALADGSLVQLNAGSAVAISFDDKQRVVHLLRGEAYFTVAKDTTRPFIVEAAGGTTTALGTEFDVRLADEEERGAAEVKVLVHAVRVAAGSAEPIVVTAGQKLLYDSQGPRGSALAIDMQLPDWRSGKLVIENESLESVVARLQHHTGTQIMVLGDALKARRVGGTFDTRDPVAAIELLCRSLDIEYAGVGSLLLILHS
jgi:transmembrane sensor